METSEFCVIRETHLFCVVSPKDTGQISIRQITIFGCRRRVGSRSIDFRARKGQYLTGNFREGNLIVEITKALAALQPLYGKDNIEIVTTDGKRVRGTVRSMKTTQALTTPSVKIEVANGQIVKIPFPTIAEIKDHNITS